MQKKTANVSIFWEMLIFVVRSIMKSEIIYLEQAEIEKLFRQLYISGSKYIVRDRAIIMLAYYCALRVSEICTMKLSDFDVQSREINCRRMQKGKDNILKIVDDRVYNALCQYYEERIAVGGDDTLFISQWNRAMTRVNVHKIFVKYCMEASIEESKRHFQVLRYSRVVDLINSGFDFEEVTWWIGVSHSERTTIHELYSMVKKRSNVYIKLEK